MKLKPVFRLFGALACSLIILAVFMPFTNTSTTNIWDMYNSPAMMYLPIMIIAFGAIGLIFFALNVKTEFAYASSGAIIFYTATLLFKSIYDKNIDSLGIGFYFLAIGGVVTGLMAFICNLRGKQNKIEPVQSSESISGNQINMPIMSAQEVNSIPQNVSIETQPVNIQPQMETPSVVTEPQPASQKPVLEPVAEEHITSPVSNINQPIPEIVEQPLSQINNFGMQNSSEIVMDSPVPIQNTAPQINSEPIPNTVQPVSPQPLPNVEAPINPTPLNNGEVVRPNPVVSQFMSQQEPQPQPVNTTNQPSNQNMQGLDIFGNFN